MQKNFKAALFDLDGVIVDTAKYHYLAWKRLADELGLYFDAEINERLKGVSRMASLDIILEKSPKAHSPGEKEAMASRKNGYYVEMIGALKPEEVLEGMPALLAELRAAGIRTAICSASKNAGLILERLGLIPAFDTIVGGNDVSRSKPDPEVFEVAARRLGIPHSDCLVFEDAAAGVAAAKAAGMKAVGIGKPDQLSAADWVVEATGRLSLSSINSSLFAQA